MQYLKDYDENLYEHIKILHSIEVKKARKETILKKIQKLFLKPIKQGYLEIDESTKDKIIQNALDFMNISKEEFIENDGICRKTAIERPKNQEAANKIWETNVQKPWLSLNVALQLRDYKNVVYGLDKLLPNNHSLSCCDWGCGSGSLSFALNEKYKFSLLDLYDLDNYPSDFVKYFIEKTNLNNANWIDILNNNDTKTYDLVICLDVLEHIENSYESLLKISSKVKKGGLLALSIAFECDDHSHLAKASQNFFIDNDGLEFLNANFKLKYKLVNHYLVSGIYEKITN